MHKQGQSRPSKLKTPKMKTKTYHITNLGSAGHAVREFCDSQGYITIHDDPRYDAMTRAQCEAELESIAKRHSDEGHTSVTKAYRYDYVRAALATRIAEIDIAAWRSRQS